MDALDDFQQRRLRVEAVIGYTFRDDEYLKVAISSGKVMFQGEEIDRCQNQLAIIGDSLLKLIYFTHNFPVAAPSTRSMFPFAHSLTQCSYMIRKSQRTIRRNFIKFCLGICCLE